MKICKIVLVATTMLAGLAAVAPATAAAVLDRIVYSSSQGGNTDIWSANADGTDRTRLTTDPAHDAYPDVSPNGRTIAFMRGLNFGSTPNRGDLWLMNTDGTGQRRLYADNVTASFRPDFSPDGRRILFVRLADGLLAQELWVINVNGTGLRRLEVDATYGSWSPDGRKIVYGSVTGVGESLNIWVSKADGTRARRLTSTNKDVAPQWSPDGRRIVFTSFRRGDGEVWVMASDGSRQHVVAASDGKDGFATWSPDGRRIAFASSRGSLCAANLAELCPHQLYTMAADGSDVRQFARATYDIHPAYFPRPRQGWPTSNDECQTREFMFVVGSAGDGGRCSFRASSRGGYEGVGNWTITIERGNETIAYSSTDSPACAPTGTIRPRDVVRVASSNGSVSAGRSYGKRCP